MHYSSVISGLLAFSSSLTAVAGSTFSPAKPPAVPLAVRSPYLNAWLQGDSGDNLPGAWPRFWTSQIQGWQGFVAVDGSVYNWLGGAPGPGPVTQTSLEYTSTQSIFTFDVDGKVTLEVTFLSPVYPDDLARQSQQFSYITTSVQASDGASHKVQVYMDVSGEWASGDVSQVIQWETETSGDISYHKFYRQNQQQFAESGEIASWGNWYLSTKSGNDVSYQIGADTVVRGQFVNEQVLANTVDSNFRAVSDNWPVFAFAKDFGSVTGEAVEALFTLGLVQNNTINFQGTAVPGLWSSFFDSEIGAVTAFYDDYAYALQKSQALDDQIQKDSVAAAGNDYATITTLALRQTFGALQFSGTPSEPYIFLKEISSNSDIQTVDVIFPAYPILLYLNATLGKYLLEPLFVNQENGDYPNAYAEHDLGTFPNALGYPNGNDEAMPLEECGNMIIMALAYAQRSGDNAYLSAHYNKLSQWAQFLVDDALIPANQLSTDDFAGTLANQTNLALKGIIGLRAMAEIANITNNSNNTWGATASDYLEQWKGFAISKDGTHTTLDYNDDSSHGLLYNLYADKLLSLNFVDQSIYDMQSKFYLTIADTYGVPLDTRHSYTKADWELFCAAIASDETKTMLISKVASWLGSGQTNRALTDLYDAVTGTFPSDGPTFVARPVVGGTYSLLALPK